MTTSPHTASIPPLPRYTRPREEVVAASAAEIIPFAQSDRAIDDSPLSDGSRALLRGLLRVGTACVFPGGGAGIEYGGLLKTAARPEYIAGHVAEAAAQLREQRVDLLLVPGMSGYPIGAMYALAAGIPALLLKKSRLGAENPHAYPTGAFIIPSYTGEGDVVMQADPAAVADIVATIVARKLDEQADHATVEIELRVGGADDIIDKATMSKAVGESALAIGEAAMGDCIARHRARTGDGRAIATRVRMAAFVTPLIKVYNHPYDHLWQAFALRPFAGVDITGVCLDPPAIGIAGVGTVAFAGGEPAG
ncbi:MAG: hypothetical protein ACRDJC_12095 [Thermomicrobiales bacterium]